VLFPGFHRGHYPPSHQLSVISYQFKTDN
jgi:hypothetical protein